MEKLARDKHSSILQKSVHYRQKSFITLAPGRSSKQTSDYGFHINLTNIRLKRSINLTNIRLKASNFADFLLDKYLLNLTSFKTLKFFVVWAQCYETFSEFTNFFYELECLALVGLSSLVQCLSERSGAYTS